MTESQKDYSLILYKQSHITRHSLAFHLHAVSVMHNISFVELVFEVIRCLLLTISQKEGFESLKIDAFILVRLSFCY
jgi:hypothetical protein